MPLIDPTVVDRSVACLWKTNMKYIYPSLESYKDKTNDDKKIVHAGVEDCFVEAWLALIRKDFGDKEADNLIIEDRNQFSIDGGGMVRAGEPIVEVEVNGCKFSTFLRQVEFALPILRVIQTIYQEELGPHVFIPGKWIKLLLTVETAEAIAKAFEKEAEERKEELESEWASYQKRTYEARDPDNLKYVAPYRSQMHERKNNGLQ